MDIQTTGGERKVHTLYIHKLSTHTPESPPIQTVASFEEGRSLRAFWTALVAGFLLPVERPREGEHVKCGKNSIRMR